MPRKKRSDDIELPFTWSKKDPGVTVVNIPFNKNKNWKQSFLLCSDRHWDNPHSDRKMQEDHLNEALERKAGVIENGDMFCGMQSRFDKRGSKSSIRHEHLDDCYLDRLVETCADWWSPWRKLLVLCGEGNHECVDEETEVLTRDGFKKASQVTTEDFVASLHPITKQFVFCNPLKTHSYAYSGKMVQIKHRGSDMLLTPNHRVAYESQVSRELKYKLAGDIVGSMGETLQVPTCGVIGNEEYAISDDEIKLTAWIMTDGSIETRQIYQSKPEMVDRIRKLLEDLSLEFSERVVERNITEICGVKLKSKTLPCYTFRILHDSRGVMSRLEIDSKEKFPQWVSKLSKRQFDIFLSEMILGDGSRHKNYKTSMMMYGTREFLENVQIQCAAQGYRAMLSFRNRKAGNGYWCLNLTERLRIAVRGRGVSSVDYNGMVYCLTTPSGNFFARRNGKMFLTGNSAIKERHETDLIQRFCGSMNAAGGNVIAGGYGGYIRFRFLQNLTTGQRGKGNSVTMRYAHGFGGGGPVTADLTQSYRMQNYLPDADIIWTGHVHEQWSRWVARLRISAQDKVYQDEVLHLKTSTYKEEYGVGEGGWHVRTGKPPKPIGAYWLHFKWSGRHDRVVFDVERAC